LKLRAEPYTLELRHDFKDTEQKLRRKLNLEWCDGALFNVIAIENTPLCEYDTILWNEKEKAILFIEYKDSIPGYKNLKAHDSQQKKDHALNIARAFGFQKYNFIIVVNGLEPNAEKVKGKAMAISLDELNNYLSEKESFESTLVELDYIDWLLSKYDRKENPVDFQKELALKELKTLRDMIEQVNK